MDKNPFSGNARFLRFCFLSLGVHLAVGLLAFFAVSSLGRRSAYLPPKGPPPEVQLDWTKASTIGSVRSQERNTRVVRPPHEGSSPHRALDPNSFQSAERKETESSNTPIQSNSPVGTQASPSTPKGSSDYEDIRKWVASLLEDLELDSAQGLRFVIELTMSDQKSSGGALKITALRFMEPPSLKLISSHSKDSLSPKVLSDQERQKIQSRLDGVPLPAHLSGRAAGQSFQIPIVIQDP